MPTLQNNMEKKQVYKLEGFLIPIISMAFSKKANSTEDSEENSIDFHLEIINKIDKLLEEHGSKTFSADSITNESAYTGPDDSYVEIRSPLSKRITSPEKKSNRIFPNRELTPEEFKTDFSENANQIKENVRIEIIDVGDKTLGDVTTKKKSILIKNGIRKFKHKFNQKSKEKSKPQDITTKKVIVIDTKEFSNNKREKIWSKKTSEPEKKAKLFYINTQKQQKDTKSNESNSEGLYIPKNFGEKLKHFEEKEKSEIQKRKNKELKKKQKELDKLKKLEEKKALLEAREKEKLARNAEKEKKKNLIMEHKKQRAKERENNKKYDVSPEESTSETETLTEWKSYDADVEISPEEPPINEDNQEKKSFDIDQKELINEREREAKIIEKKKLEELKKQQRENRIKEKEDKKTKKLEEKKALLEAREKEKLARNAEKEKKKNLIMEHKKQRAKEREAEKENKIAIKEEKKKEKEKKPLKFFTRTKESEEKHELPLETIEKSVDDEKRIVEIPEKDKEEHEEIKEKSEPTLLDEDIKKLLVITDDLLGKLPEEVIDEFSKSDDFKLYSKIFSKYKIK